MYTFIPHLTATRLQAATYLLGIALFSISFLVFLNSSISFVVTDVIGQKENVGDAVGTLGFADELIALVACPLWGLLSDRIGVRPVAVAGYCIVGLALICLVQSENVYPELLLARLGFSVGGAACSTMVTAVLPAMVAHSEQQGSHMDEEAHISTTNDHARHSGEERPRKGYTAGRGHEQTPSVNSELTITQHRYTTASQDRADSTPEPDDDGTLHRAAGTSKLAGFVGLFTGAGALLALAVFLPLPARFQGDGHDPAKSVQISFYIVAAVSFCVAVFIFWGLRNLPGESEKSMSALWKRPYDETTRTDAQGNLHIILTPASSYFALIKDAVLLGFTDSAIGLGYVGGFVARASSVGISLFIPLFVNAYFVRSGLCTSNPDNLTDIKDNCKKAYTLAAALTGIAETAALICAPLFGWLGGRVVKGRSEWPLFGAATVGTAGYLAFGFLKSPDAFHDSNGRWAFLAVILIGISQIGSIVCSLSLLGRGIQHQAPRDSRVSEHRRPATASTTTVGHDVTATGSEAAPLLPPAYSTADSEIELRDRAHLKGTIAGVYSFAGGAGILLLIAETAALICAPLFGWLGGRVVKGRSEWPLFGAATVGTAGYLAFGFLKSPDAFHDSNGRWAFLAVILIGISQIGSIVCSLSLLGRGIQHQAPRDSRVSEHRRPATASTTTVGHDVTATGSEAAPLLPPAYSTADSEIELRDRAHLKGTIAGVYSFAGGAGILLLTKLGGVLFDSWHAGAPFFMLAIFNGVLMVVVSVVGGGKAVLRKRND
nr:hypothetical protein CFP56_09439 [Quercus suber]